MPSSTDSAATLEFLGTTTFRLEANGVTIFHDCWLERPSTLPNFLKPEDVKKCDVILINHAHFDHIPGADKVAIATGATVIANREACLVLEQNGVPPSQLIPVAGGEYIAVGDSGIVIRPYPGLHCLMPFAHGEQPEVLPSEHEWIGTETQSVRDITQLMTKGLGGIVNVPDEMLPTHHLREFKKYMVETKGRWSLWDGGCLMFNITIPGQGTIFFNGHTGGYPGILSDMEPRPNIAVLSPAGQPCVNGRGFTGTTAEYTVDALKRLGEPKHVIWQLHDTAPLPPYIVDTKYVDQLVSEQTRTRVLTLEPGKPIKLDW